MHVASMLVVIGLATTAAGAPVGVTAVPANREETGGAGGEEARVAGVPWHQPSGQGVALGFDNGAWGEAWAQGLRLEVPIARHFALVGRGLFLSVPAWVSARPEHLDIGGRIEIYGRSSLLLNVIRLYGGGGAQLMYPVTEVKGEPLWGGGGQFGFELFLSARLGFFLEIGGNGGQETGTDGATVLAGLKVYPL